MSNIRRHIEYNRILDKFRFTFYTLKYKNKFRNWLWINVREKKIHSIFHMYLNKIINNEIEMYEDYEEEEIYNLISDEDYEEEEIYNLISHW